MIPKLKALWLVDNGILILWDIGLTCDFSYMRACCITCWPLLTALTFSDGTAVIIRPCSLYVSFSVGHSSVHLGLVSSKYCSNCKNLAYQCNWLCNDAWQISGYPFGASLVV